MNALKNYVIARMLWDPSLNPDELIDAFLRGYYRSAAPHIRHYMQVMHQAVQVRTEGPARIDWPSIFVLIATE